MHERPNKRMGIPLGSDPLGSGPTGPGSGYSVMPNKDIFIAALFFQNVLQNVLKKD